MQDFVTTPDFEEVKKEKVSMGTQMVDTSLDKMRVLEALEAIKSEVNLERVQMLENHSRAHDSNQVSEPSQLKSTEEPHLAGSPKKV